jgi:hypothetical protein
MLTGLLALALALQCAHGCICSVSFNKFERVGCHLNELARLDVGCQNLVQMAIVHPAPHCRDKFADGVAGGASAVLQGNNSFFNELKVRGQWHFLLLWAGDMGLVWPVRTTLRVIFDFATDHMPIAICRFRTLTHNELP